MEIHQKNQMVGTFVTDRQASPKSHMPLIAQNSNEKKIIDKLISKIFQVPGHR